MGMSRMYFPGPSMMDGWKVCLEHLFELDFGRFLVIRKHIKAKVEMNHAYFIKAKVNASDYGFMQI